MRSRPSCTDRATVRAMPRGRILAIKWGMNPNSSSLGVDVTFLLFGAAAVALVTPVVGALLRLRRVKAKADGGTSPG